MTEDLFTFQVHLLVLYNAAFQINSAIFLQIVPNIHHCPADPPRNCNVVSCPSVVQELTLTKFQTEKKKVVVSPCKQIQNIFGRLEGKKKQPPPSTLECALLWRSASCKKKNKNNPAYLTERRFDVHFCPCIKAAKKAVYYSLKGKLYLLLPAHPTVAS